VIRLSGNEDAPEFITWIGRFPGYTT